MKKVFTLCMAGLLTLGLSGCGGKSDEEVAKDVQDKIEKANWEIKHDPDAGTAVDDLDLIVGTVDEKEQSFGLTLFKEDKSVDYVSFDLKAYGEQSESLGYNASSEEDDLFSYFDVGSCAYNPITKEVNEAVTTSDDCKIDAPKRFKALSKTRDEILKDADITLDELHTWGVWYHQNND